MTFVRFDAIPCTRTGIPDSERRLLGTPDARIGDVVAACSNVGEGGEPKPHAGDVEPVSLAPGVADYVLASFLGTFALGGGMVLALGFVVHRPPLSAYGGALALGLVLGVLLKRVFGFKGYDYDSWCVFVGNAGAQRVEIDSQGRKTVEVVEYSAAAHVKRTSMRVTQAGSGEVTFVDSVQFLDAEQKSLFYLASMRYDERVASGSSSAVNAVADAALSVRLAESRARVAGGESVSFLVFGPKAHRLEIRGDGLLLFPPGAVKQRELAWSDVDSVVSRNGSLIIYGGGETFAYVIKDLADSDVAKQLLVEENGDRRGPLGPPVPAPV